MFRNRQFYNVSFCTSYTEINDAYIDIMTQRFNSCLDELKEKLPIKIPVAEEPSLAETFRKQEEDSNMIFNQITHGDFPTWELAEQALVTIYIPDMTISRAGISHAMKRLQKFYKDKQ